MINIYRKSEKVATVSHERDGSFELCLMSGPTHCPKQLELRRFADFDSLRQYLDEILALPSSSH